MKNTFGQALTVTLAGESHGKALVVTLDGLTPGIPVDEAYIAARLALRRPAGRHSTKRREPDEFSIVSGVFNGRTTGTPLCIYIPNTDTNSRDYTSLASHFRPGHADYTAALKYGGCQDYRGGGHFSGRITAALVAAGAVATAALESEGVRIGTHIAAIGGVSDRAFGSLEDEIPLLASDPFPVLDGEAKAAMEKAIDEAREQGDSVGGILETAVIGLPGGLGEPWFDSVESILSHLLFSIPAVKGVEFGSGFGFAALRGSEANDCFTLKDGAVKTVTNRNGGINGGITNGMPILFRTAIKPTPSISKEQKTLNFETKAEEILSVGGRHDPCIVHRAAAVVNAVTALGLLDLLTVRYGNAKRGE